MIEPQGAPPFVEAFPRSRHVAEVTPGGRSGLGRGQAFLDEAVGFEIQVRLDLAREVLVFAASG